MGYTGGMRLGVGCTAASGTASGTASGRLVSRDLVEGCSEMDHVELGATAAPELLHDLGKLVKPADGDHTLRDAVGSWGAKAAAV